MAGSTEALSTVVRMSGVLRTLARAYTPPSGQGRRTPTMIPIPVRVVSFAVPGVLGAVVFEMLSGRRAALSFAAGVAISAAIFIVGIMAVRAGAALSPVIATAMALSTYTTAATLLLAALAIVDPQVASVPSLAAGLVVGVVVGVALQLRDARPPAVKD
jgi:hypothetical protein